MLSRDHGGNLYQASKDYNIPMENWLDLSTGINPVSYPVANLSQSVLEQLPYSSSQFEAAVGTYSGVSDFVAGNGSQQFIQLLPKILPRLPVLLPDWGYQEHHFHWQRNQNPVRFYPAIDPATAVVTIENQLATEPACHLLIVNPNNPSGLVFKPEQLRHWAGMLAEKKTDGSAVLIVDEAFVDCDPELSLLNDSLPPNVIVLRSFGKFFGLAGLRLGFAFAQQHWLNPIRDAVGLWNINGPAMAVATRALFDESWQKVTRDQLRHKLPQWQCLFDPMLQKLEPHFQVQLPLFSSYGVSIKQGRWLQHQFARVGILLRVIENDRRSLVRFGRFDLTRKDDLERVQLAIQSCLQGMDSIDYPYDAAD